MVGVGDLVARTDPGQRKHTKGRVTGFAPNGWARVRLNNGQGRIWPVDRLIVEQSKKDIELRRDLDAWVTKVGPDRADRMIATLRRFAHR